MTRYRVVLLTCGSYQAQILKGHTYFFGKPIWEPLVAHLQISEKDAIEVIERHGQSLIKKSPELHWGYVANDGKYYKLRDDND